MENKINRLKYSRAWYHWDKIAFAFNLYKDYESYQEECFEKGLGLSAMALKRAHDEISLILSNKYDEKDVNNIELVELREGLQFFHLEFKQLLESALNKETGIKSENITSFVKSTGELKISGKVTKFSKSKFIYYVLNQLLNVKSKKQVSRGEDLVKFEGIEITGDKVDTKEHEKRFYNAFYNANKQIKLDTGCEDFFIFNSTVCQINAKYLA